MAKFIAYYRVSTQRQGQSGLGVEAQQRAVSAYVGSVGGRIVGEYHEVESGANDARTQLGLALADAKSKKAMIVIAKLDRLARSVHFVSNLLESGVEFVVADMPHANKLTMHIIAAVAEHERELISQRTKAALQQAKARGVVLGNPNAGLQAKAASDRAKQNADRFALEIMPRIKMIQAEGVTSLARIAAMLNDLRFKTQRGRRWTATGVSNVIRRASRLGSFSASEIVPQEP